MRLLPNKRRLKRIAIGLGMLLALVLIVNGIFAWWTERQWRNRLAAIRAAGNPASIAELAPEPIPDDQNAAAIIERIQPVLTSLNKAYSDFSKSNVGKNYEEMHDRGEAPTPAQTEAIKAILESHAEVTAAVDAAVAAGKYASLLDYSLDYQAFSEELLERGPQIRGIARHYDWKMRMLIDEGKYEEAVRTGLQMLRLTRLYESEPTIVNQLIAIACRQISIEGIDRALRAGPISTETREALDEELKLQDDPNTLVHTLTTERALSVTAMEYQLHRASPILARLLGWPGNAIGALDYYDVQLGLIAEPWYKVHTQVGRTGEPTGFGVLADLLIPALQAMHDAFSRVQALTRALRISNALAAFRQQHGREAEGLEELPLSKESVIDPFSGKPLKLKSTPDGWVIYSVFTNQVDDGGDFRDLKDCGLAPPGYQINETP